VKAKLEEKLEAREKRGKFEELKRRVKVLYELLSDPQPGLASWCISYAEQMEWIVRYWKEN
jgi:hypothetical protein